MPPPAHTPAAVRSPELTHSTTSTSSPLSPPRLPSSLVPQVDALERILEDLQSYQIPQLGDCRGPKPLFDQLTTQVRSELARVKRDLDELRLDVEDLTRARERESGFWHLNQLQEFLDQCTKGYRSAVVQAKRVVDASQHYLNRDELLAPTPGTGRDTPALAPPGGQPSGEDALMSATSDVTEGLRRTLQLLQSEVDRSQVSNELLEQQTQTMASTSNEYSTLSSLLSTSKNLITSLERADILDRLVLFGAFSFFVGVCSYIFKKRVIDRGLKVATAVGGVLGRGGGGGGTTKDQVRDLVKEEFKGEMEKVAIATAAVIGAVKRAREAVGDRLKERDNVSKGEPDGENDARLERAGGEGGVEGIFDEVVQRVTSLTASPTSPSVVTPVPTTTPEHDVLPEEEDSGGPDDLANEIEEAEEVEDTAAESSIPTPSTSATAPPEPTHTSTESSVSEEQAEHYSPEPTPEPSPSSQEILVEDVAEQPVEEEEEVNDSMLEPTEIPSAEPEIDIAAPSIPVSTDSSSPPPPPPPPSEPDVLEQKAEEEIVEAINPRQVHPPKPSHSREQVEEIFSPEPDVSSTGESREEEELVVAVVDDDDDDEEEEKSTPIHATDPEFATASPSPLAPRQTPPAPLVPGRETELDDDDDDDNAMDPLQLVTTPLDTTLESDLNPETIPRLDVEEELAVGGGEEVVRESTSDLPVDFDKEQSIWEESPVGKDTEVEERSKGADSDEGLLDDMLERQMVGGGARVGGFVGNATKEEVEPETAGAEEEEGEAAVEIDEQEESPSSDQEEEEEEPNKIEPSVSVSSDLAPEQTPSIAATTTMEEEDEDVTSAEAPRPESVPEPSPQDVAFDTSSAMQAQLPASPTPVPPLEPEEEVDESHELSAASHEPTASPASIIFEELPSPSRDLDDFVLESSELLSTEDDIVYNLDPEGSITEPLDSIQNQEEEEEEEAGPTRIGLPTSFPSRDDSPIEQLLDDDASETILVTSSAVATSPGAPVLEVEETPNSIVAAPTPAPSSLPEVTPFAAAPTPQPSIVENEGSSSQYEEEEEEDVEIPLPQAEFTSSVSPLVVSASSPEPVTETATPSSTPTSSLLPDPVTEEIHSPDDDDKDDDDDDGDDLANSDLVFPPADVDEPSIPTRVDEGYDSVSGELPIYEDSELVAEGAESGGDELEPAEFEVDEQASEEVPPPVSSPATHVEL